MSAFTRSRQHHIIAGVMGGIAERYGWNISILRVLFVIFSISSAAFPGILVYLVLWMLMPLADKNSYDGIDSNQGNSVANNTAGGIKTVKGRDVSVHKIQ